MPVGLQDSFTTLRKGVRCNTQGCPKYYQLTILLMRYTFSFHALF